MTWRSLNVSGMESIPFSCSKATFVPSGTSIADFRVHAIRRLEQAVATCYIAIHFERGKEWGQGNMRFTREKSGAVDAVYLAGDGEITPPPRIRINAFSAKEGSSVHLLGRTGSLAWHVEGDGMTIELTQPQRENLPCEHAWTFRIDEPAEKH